MSGMYAFLRFHESVVSLMPAFVESEMEEMRDSKMAVMASRSSLVRWVLGFCFGALGSLARSLRILGVG